MLLLKMMGTSSSPFTIVLAQPNGVNLQGGSCNCAASILSNFHSADPRHDTIIVMVMASLAS